MTPRETTLRSTSLPALLLQPVHAIVIESPLSAKALALAVAVVAYVLSHDLFFIAWAFAFVASTMDYLIGHRLAEVRDAIDEAVATNGLLVKLTALSLLLFVWGMDTWVLTRLGAPSLAGMVSAGCCTVWIHKELKSIDRHTAGRIPFLRPFLVILDTTIGRLLPDPPKPDPESGVSEFVRRRQDAAHLGAEPPVRREYDPVALELEQQLETPTGETFHDAAIRRDDEDPPSTEKG